MIFNLKKIKAIIYKLKANKLNSGMTYVELIVVLSIFAIMSSVAIFNYGDFQAKVDIKNLANDIALQIVQAQKYSLSGTLPQSSAQQALIDSTWKPSYGVYFNLTENPTNPDSSDGGIPFNKKFIYFTDLGSVSLPQNKSFDGAVCTGECIDRLTITKGDYISEVASYLNSSPDHSVGTYTDLSITFTRPDSSATFKSNTLPLTGFDYMQITVSSANGKATATIKIYPSGRVQVN